MTTTMILAWYSGRIYSGGKGVENLFLPIACLIGVLSICILIGWLRDQYRKWHSNRTNTEDKTVEQLFEDYKISKPKVRTLRSASHAGTDENKKEHNDYN